MKRHGGTENGQLFIEDTVIDYICDMVKDPYKLDEMGACIKVLRRSWVSKGAVVQNLLNSDKAWEGIQLNGFAKAKAQGPIPVSKTRGLVPQWSILQACHLVVRTKLEPVLDAWSQRHGTADIVLGSSRGGTPADLYFTALRVLEVGRDRKDEAVVGQADVKGYHDSIYWGALWGSLRARGDGREWGYWCSAAIRVHRCAGVSLRVGQEASTGTLQRHKGLLTGASSAAILARLPTEDSFLRLEERWRKLEWGFLLRNRRLYLMIWSDNLLSFSPNKHQSASMLRDMEIELGSFGCALKSGVGDLTLQQARAGTATEGTYEDGFGRTWVLQDECRILGPTLSGLGHAAPDLLQTEKSIRAGFYANARFFLNQMVPIATRMKKLDSIAIGVIRARAAAWTPSRTCYEQVNRLQNELIARMLCLRPRPGDTDKSFTTWRNGVVSRTEKVPWALRAAESAVSWASHMLRHPSDPAARAQETQGQEWVEALRNQHSQLSRTTLTSRTLTRAARGPVIRWDGGGWIQAVGVPTAKDPEKLKQAALKLLERLRLCNEQTAQAFL